MIKVLVASLSSSEAPRSDLFFQAFGALLVPEGSEKKRFIGDALRNMDDAISYMKEGNFTHIFFIDDDHTFKPEILINLLTHNVDVVTGLYLQRSYPFRPNVFDKALEERSLLHFIELKETPGLAEVVACGMGCFLIKANVFNSLSHPYFNLIHRHGVRVGCDVLFCEDLRKAGYKIYCDTTQVCWHLIRAYIAPRFNEQTKSWLTLVNVGNGNIEIDAYAEAKC